MTKIGLDHHQIDLLILVQLIQPCAQVVFPCAQTGVDFKTVKFMIFYDAVRHTLFLPSSRNLGIVSFGVILWNVLWKSIMENALQTLMHQRLQEMPVGQKVGKNSIHSDFRVFSADFLNKTKIPETLGLTVIRN